MLHCTAPLGLDSCTLTAACVHRPICYCEQKAAKGAGGSDGLVTEAMDIFSAGCVIAEIFLEGEAIFDLPQLLSYREGKYDPTPAINKIADKHVRELVTHMVQRDATLRLSAKGYLQQYTEVVFPKYFGFLYKFFAKLLSPELADPDIKIQAIRHHDNVILREIVGAAAMLNVPPRPKTKQNSISGPAGAGPPPSTPTSASAAAGTAPDTPKSGAAPPTPSAGRNAAAPETKTPASPLPSIITRGVTTPVAPSTPTPGSALTSPNTKPGGSLALYTSPGGDTKLDSGSSIAGSSSVKKTTKEMLDGKPIILTVLFDVSESMFDVRCVVLQQNWRRSLVVFSVRRKHVNPLRLLHRLLRVVQQPLPAQSLQTRVKLSSLHTSRKVWTRNHPPVQPVRVVVQRQQMQTLRSRNSILN